MISTYKTWGVLAFEPNEFKYS